MTDTLGRLPPVLFRDPRFVVLDKPAGLPVHPGPRGGPSVEDWFPLLSHRKVGPWLAHRLDADTAGCLVIALRRAALLAAQAEFAAGRADKTYWAVVVGSPSTDSGTVDAPLRRQSERGGWHMRVDPAGQAARTDWRIAGRGDGLTWLELHPHTGRTHQVRVHCAVLGCPILGDPIYGSLARGGAARGGPAGGGPAGREPPRGDQARGGPIRGGPTRGDPARGDPPRGGAPIHGGPACGGSPIQGGGGPLHLLARAIRLRLDPPVAATALPPRHMVAALRQCGWQPSDLDQIRLGPDRLAH